MRISSRILYSALLLATLTTQACTSETGNTEEPIENSDSEAAASPVDPNNPSIEDTGIPAEKDDGKYEDLSAAYDNATDDPVTILFENKQTKLSRDAKDLLQQVAERMKTDLGLRIRLEAYTDAKGSSPQNKNLASQRASLIRKELIAFGVDSKRIKIAAFGKANMGKSGKTNAERALSRRVDLNFE